MSVVIVGKAPAGNILVTDAMVMKTPTVKSFKDCELKDKILRLSTSKIYCGLLGDENIGFGIQMIDEWCFLKSLPLDFKDYTVMNKALAASENNIKAVNHFGNQMLDQDVPSMIYFVDRNDVFYYKVLRNDNRYSILDFGQFAENKVIINYGGYIEDVTLNGFASDYFEKCKNLIEKFHHSRKEISKSDVVRRHLPYDFDDRFSGVLFEYNEDHEKFMSPYKNLSDMMSNNDWELMESEDFKWSPED